MDVGAKYSVDSFIGKTQLAESIAKAAAVAANQDEFIADQTLQLQQGDTLAKAKSAESGRKQLPKNSKPANVKSPQEIRKVLSTESLEKQLDEKADGFVAQFPVLKKMSLKNLRREIEALGPDATSEQILEVVTRSYGKGHEAEADHALQFLLETTTGALHEAIAKAKADFNRDHQKEIKQSLRIEEMAIEVRAKVGKGDVTTFNNKFVDLVSESPTTISLYKNFRKDFPNPEERTKIIAAYYQAIGREVRTIDVEDPKQTAAAF